MSKRTSRFAPRLPVLLLVAVLLGLTGYFLRDFRGVAYGPLGSVLWLGALLISFVLGTVYLSRVLLPIPGNAGWTEGFRLLWRHYLQGSPGLPRDDDNSRPATLDAKLKRAEGFELDSSFQYLNAGFLPSHEAAAIVYGNRYRRSAGPGLVVLNRGETISATFDLRPHSRSRSITVNTRDGIPLKTTITVTFRVRRPTEPQAGGDTSGEPARPEIESLPYPYDRDAIFLLNYAVSVGEGETVRPWTEQILPLAATLLVNEIALNTLDELEMTGSEPLNRIKRRIERQLKSQFLLEGIEILSVGIGPLEPPDKVIDQRLRSWQVEWQGKVAQEQATAEAEATRLIQQARARAQIDIIENLVQSIEAMRGQSDAELHDIIMLRLTEVVNTSAADPAVRAMLPGRLMETLALETTNQLREDPDDDSEARA